MHTQYLCGNVQHLVLSKFTFITLKQELIGFNVVILLYPYESVIGSLLPVGFHKFSYTTLPKCTFLQVSCLVVLHVLLLFPWTETALLGKLTFSHACVCLACKLASINPGLVGFWEQIRFLQAQMYPKGSESTIMLFVQLINESQMKPLGFSNNFKWTCPSGFLNVLYILSVKELCRSLHICGQSQCPRDGGGCSTLYPCVQWDILAIHFLLMKTRCSVWCLRPKWETRNKTPHTP